MALLVGEAHHLVLDRGAVARAGAVNRALVHGRPVQVLADDAMRLGGGVGQVAARGIFEGFIGQEGKGHDRLVALLRLHLRKIDRAAVHAGGGAGLKPSHLEAQVDERLGERAGADQSLRAARPGAVADDDAALQVHAAAQHNRAARDRLVGRGHNPRHAAVFGQYARGLALAKGQVRLIFHGAAHAGLVGGLVGLGAQRVYRRPLAGVEHAGLQKGVVDGAAHFAAQRVHLAHQMSLRRAADGRVAGHHGDRVQVERQ